MSDKTVSVVEAPVTSPNSAYEPPVLTFIGNLNDVVAGTTQALACDAGAITGDGNSPANPTPPFCP
jgi:hypothetical protein